MDKTTLNKGQTVYVGGKKIVGERLPSAPPAPKPSKSVPKPEEAKPEKD